MIIDGTDCPAPQANAARRPGSATSRTRLRAVAVIVPARDEQELLGACLDRIESAAWRVRRQGLAVFALAVADACTDATRAVARGRGISCLTINRRNAGAARAAGVAHALEELSRRGTTPAETLLLHTDADSVISSDWITRHVEAARAQDAVVGRVAVRGTNLGVRADAYLRVDGFLPLPAAEDRALIHALRTTGESVVFAQDIVVHSSMRIAAQIA